jgi:hypothetical protein
VTATTNAFRVPPCSRPGRIYVATVVFLLSFGVVIFLVSFNYLIPALEATRDATAVERKQLSATARLILAVILSFLFVLMLLVFRVGRFFLPRARERAAPTQYSDAWAESAKRLDEREEEDD